MLGDEFGNIVHLGERDCSVQKPSHQKLIEETPAPHLSTRSRNALHEMALRAARYVGYTNAGTLEFLVAGDDAYFMEMNTRIQVEHPVTEMVYNIDLVKEQIRIASGEPLGYTQRDLVARGHAIECRINAEDPRNNFAPAAGTVSKLVFPGGPGIRVDTHLYAGAIYPAVLRFDDREDRRVRRLPARSRSRAWSARCAKRSIEGVNTTIALCLEILATPAFRQGRYDIEFIPSRILSNGEVTATRRAMTSRRVAREQALQALYSIVIGDREPRDAVSEIVGESADSEQRAFVEELALGTLEYAERADRIVSPLLEGWAIERLPTIDRLLLEMATFELHCRPETPEGGRDQRGGRARQAILHRGFRTFRQRRSERGCQCQDVERSGAPPRLAGHASRAADDRALRAWSRCRHGRRVRAQPSGHQPNGRLPAGRARRASSRATERSSHRSTRRIASGYRSREFRPSSAMRSSPTKTIISTTITASISKASLRAALADLTHQQFQGASTITQQLARRLFLNDEVSLSRKIQEALLAIEIERYYTKDEILERYLNIIYLGAGAYGVDAAAHTYFGRERR